MILFISTLANRHGTVYVIIIISFSAKKYNYIHILIIDTTYRYNISVIFNFNGKNKYYNILFVVLNSCIHIHNKTFNYFENYEILY